jgi:hypothetical protein
MLFAFGVVIGLSIGSRVAIREVEMMFRLAKREYIPRNRVWESIKFQNAYLKLKNSLNFERRWKRSKNELRINRTWENTKGELLYYDMKALRTWRDVNITTRRRKREISSQYLISR